MITKVLKWLHNRKLNTPMCPCGWKMIPSTRKHFEQYWICKWKECTGKHLQQQVIELDFGNRKWAFYYIQKWLGIWFKFF